jgi:protein RecA
VFDGSEGIPERHTLAEPDVKERADDLTYERVGADVTVYKMHGSVRHLADVVLATDDFELYPRGRVVEVYGPESSGKTTLALHAITQVQRAGGVAAFIDAEHAVDVAYARSIGVQTEKLLISQPDAGEQALDITEMLVRSGAVDLVVIDSVARLGRSVW